LTEQKQYYPQKQIHETNNRKHITNSYELPGHILEVIDNSKYLGVTINIKLSWPQHTSKSLTHCG